jgi:hypothetical protein
MAERADQHPDDEGEDEIGEVHPSSIPRERARHAPM